MSSEMLESNLAIVFWLLLLIFKIIYFKNIYKQIHFFLTKKNLARIQKLVTLVCLTFFIFFFPNICVSF